MSDGFRHDRVRSATSTTAAATSTRRSLVATVGLCAGALATVLAISVAGPSVPASAAQRTSAAARDNDRTLKLDLIDRLKSSPETLILGSSRAKRAQPAYLRKLTGRTAFNAGVTGGTAADAWVMTRYMADCFPHKKLRYLWFVDVGIATNGINPDLTADPRSHRYLESTGGSDVTGRSCAPGDRTASSPYNPDGSYTRSVVSRQRGRARNLDDAVAKLIATVRAGKGHNYKTDPTRLVWFEKALAFMNSRGARPVIVLNPIHPAVLAELRKYGFPARRVAAADFHRLHKCYDFVVVDAQDIGRWGGSPDDFWDPTHINYANMRRLLSYVVNHSHGALR